MNFFTPYIIIDRLYSILIFFNNSFTPHQLIYPRATTEETLFEAARAAADILRAAQTLSELTFSPNSRFFGIPEEVVKIIASKAARNNSLSKPLALSLAEMNCRRTFARLEKSSR